MHENIFESFNSTRGKLIINFNYEVYSKGYYAFFLAKLDDKKLFKNWLNRIVYIGSAKESIFHRIFCTHLNINKTPFSTLRTSIGITLFEELKLNLEFYRTDKIRFDASSELLLSNWIIENLEFGYYISEDVSSNMEKELIKTNKPLLNLSHNQASEYYKDLKELRKKIRIKSNLLNQL